MKVITFYSFRGGVGRSMALANVAQAMVETGERKVLLLDLDLEAPGLSFMKYFQSKKRAKLGGIVEYMLAWQNGQNPLLADYLSDSAAHGHALAVSRAGTNLLGELRFDKLLAAKRGKTFPEYFRIQAQALGYHYVLVDSRTGLTEMSGLCTLALADLVVVLSGLNQQNLEGTRWVLKQLRKHPLGAKQFILVYSHVPDSEEDLKERVLSRAHHFLKLPRDLEPTQLTYHPRMSLDEELFIRRRPKSTLALRYRQLFGEIIRTNPEDPEEIYKSLEHGYLPGGTASEKLERAERLVLRHYPSNPRLLRALGGAYFEKGRIADHESREQRAAAVKAAGYTQRALELGMSPSLFDYIRILDALLMAKDIGGIRRMVRKGLTVAEQARPDQRQIFFEHLATIAQRLWKQRKIEEAANLFDISITKGRPSIETLANDAELALCRRDKKRFRDRFERARGLLTPRHSERFILPFLAWISEPNSDPMVVFAAWKSRATRGRPNWDFKDTEPALSRLRDADRSLAAAFIALFNGNSAEPEFARFLQTWKKQRKLPKPRKTDMSLVGKGKRRK